MKKFALLVAAVLASVACAHTAFFWNRIAGDGTLRTESRALSDFNELDVSGDLEVTVRTGAPSLTLEGDSNLLSLYRSEVKQGRLELGLEHHASVRPSRPIRAVVSVPRLSRLEASGGVEVRLEAATAQVLVLDLSGGVELAAPNLDVDALSVDASGGVELDLAGRAKRASVDVSGGVSLDASELLVTTANVDASGGCDLELRATETIRGSLSGGVGLKVFGNPQLRHVSTSGGADVEFVD